MLKCSSVPRLWLHNWLSKYLGRTDLAVSLKKERQKAMRMLLGLALLAVRSRDGWALAGSKGHGAWHSRDNMMFELDAGLEKISCLDEISTWIFIVKVLRIVPEWLVKATISVAINTQISSRGWSYPTTPMREGLQSLWY